MPKKQIANQMLYYHTLLLLCFGFFFQLCIADSFTRKDIGQVGWKLSFISRTYDVNAAGTVFTYRLQVLAWEKDLSHWVLGMTNQLERIQTYPSDHVEYANPDPTTQVIGLKWDEGQAKNTTAIYSITFRGVVAAGTVLYSVKGGTYYAVSETIGPIKTKCNCPVDMSLL